MAVGDSIIEHDQIDSILVGLSEKYNSFLMQMYENHEPLSLFDVEALLHVQEVQLDKFRQELVVLNIYANITHTNSQIGGVHETSTRIMVGDTCLMFEDVAEVGPHQALDLKKTT